MWWQRMPKVTELFGDLGMDEHRDSLMNNCFIKTI